MCPDDSKEVWEYGNPSHLLTCENNGMTICADPQRKVVEHMIVTEAGKAKW